MKKGKVPCLKKWILKDLRFLETLGRLLCLVPVKKNLQSPSETCPAAKVLFKNSKCIRSEYSLVLAIISMVLVIGESIWAYHTLNLSAFRRNSEKIHYGIFQVSLWISSAMVRLAFLIAAPKIQRFICFAKSYVEEFITEDDLNQVTTIPDIPEDTCPRKSHPAYAQLQASKIKLCKYRYKFMSKFLLNVIFLAQIIEFLYRHFSTRTAAEVIKSAANCQGNFPCVVTRGSTLGYVLRTATYLTFKLMSTLTMYYLTYFIITMSDLLLEVLKGFRKDIYKRLESRNPSGGNLTDFTSENDLASFIIKKTGQNTTKTAFEKKFQYNLGFDLHDQFSRLRLNFLNFNKAIGLPVIVATLADLLVIISITFSMIPKMQGSNRNTPCGSDGQFGGGIITGNGINIRNNVAHLLTSFGGGGGFMRGDLGGNFDNSNLYTVNNNGSYNDGGGHNYSDSGLGYHNDGSNYYNGENPHGSNDGDESEVYRGSGAASLLDMEFGTSDELSILFIIFALLFEARAVITATSGSLFKVKISKLKEKLEDRVQRTFSVMGCDPTVQSVVNRVEKWEWSFRPLEMITVDLSMIPVMIATVMTYVVVLLQIQISEDSMGM